MEKKELTAEIDAILESYHHKEIDLLDVRTKFIKCATQYAEAIQKQQESDAVEFLNFIEDNYYLILLSPKTYVLKMSFNFLEMNPQERLKLFEKNGVNQQELYQLFKSNNNGNTK